MKEHPVFTSPFIGFATGALIAFGVALFAGTAYREGNLFAFLIALVVALGSPFLLYRELPKQLTYALLAAAFLTVFSLLAGGLGGQLTGLTVFGLAIAAVAIVVGTDLVLQDFGSRLTITPVFSYGATAVFLIVALPLTIQLLSREHRIAVEEDDALIRTVAQHVHPQGNTIVFDAISPQQEEKLKKLVSVHTKEKTYNLADAEVESVVKEKTVRRKSRTQSEPAVVSREQEERMRMILRLQGAKVPEDITLVTRRGPVTTSEVTVALADKNPG
ncbi:MAG: hypothetical protein AB7G75_32010 [Candidatus Binatia bacterium]